MAIIPENKTESAPTMTAALTRDPVCLVLRKAREAAGYDVPDIAQLLRIQKPYLEAIEDGRYGDLPGTVYAIGFVRTYSDFLSLDTDDVVRRFKEEASELSKRTDYVFPVAPAEARVPSIGLLVIGVLLAALAYGVWHISTSDDGQLAGRVSEIPDRFAELASRSEAPAPVASPTATPEPELQATADSMVEPAGVSPATPPDLDALAALAASRAQAFPQQGAAEQPAAEPVVADLPVVAAPVAAVSEPEPAYQASEDVPSRLDPAPSEIVIPVVIAEPAPRVPAEPTPPAPIDSVQTVDTIQRVPPSAPGDPAPRPTFDVAVATTPDQPSENGLPKAAMPEEQGRTVSIPTNILPNRQPAVAETPPPPLVPDQTRRVGVGSSNSRILIRATEMSWVQITDDLGNLVMTRVLDRGQSYWVPNTDGLILASGNAGGLEVLVDGVVQPPLGLRGTVVRNVALNPESFGTN